MQKKKMLNDGVKEIIENKKENNEQNMSVDFFAANKKTAEAQKNRELEMVVDCIFLFVILAMFVAIVLTTGSFFEEINVDDYTVGGIRYDIVNGEATVIGLEKTKSYVKIPSYVRYKGIKCKVTSIGSYAFYDMDNIVSISVPNSLISIGEAAFFECSNLEKIVIPKSVISIGANAFFCCFELKIYCEASKQPIGWNVDWNNFDICPVVWEYKD